MAVLIACEESQTVCKAFRGRGIEAYSCDIQKPSGGHPEWHILGDALDAVQGGSVTTMDGKTHDVGRWELLIAHPPCTKTSNAGARHLYKGGKLNIKRYYEGLCGKALFLAIWSAPSERLVIENPTPSRIFDFPKPTQIIQPYEYGEPYTKKTLLWERGVPPLEPTNVVQPLFTWCPSGSYSIKHAKEKRGMFTTNRERNRAKTFPGIAAAMGETLYYQKEVKTMKTDDAIKILSDYIPPHTTTTPAAMAWATIKNALSERPAVVRGKDCIYYDSYELCRWRQDEQPDVDDYCSAGEAAPNGEE